MLAIIKTGGKQYLVEPGTKLKIEKLDNKEGSEVVFDQVLLLQKGNKLEIGEPFVKEAKVAAKVLKQGRRDKIIVFKFKTRKRYKRKKGHKQFYTEVEILTIH